MIRVRIRGVKYRTKYRNPVNQLTTSLSKHMRSSKLFGLHIYGVYFAVGLQTEEDSAQKIIIMMNSAQSLVKLNVLSLH